MKRVARRSKAPATTIKSKIFAPRPMPQPKHRCPKKKPHHSHALRLWLWLGLIMFLIIWAITPTVFWPMIRELYGSAKGRISHTDGELVQLAHRWIVWDWFRVSLIAVGFIASVRALSLPATGNRSNQSLQPTAGRSDA